MEKVRESDWAAVWRRVALSGQEGHCQPQRLVAGVHMTICVLGRRRVIESQRDFLGCLGRGCADGRGWWGGKFRLGRRQGCRVEGLVCSSAEPCLDTPLWSSLYPSGTVLEDSTAITI